MISFPNNLLTNNIFEAVIGEGGICDIHGYGTEGGQTKLKLSTGSSIIDCSGGRGGVKRLSTPVPPGGLPPGGDGGGVQYILPGVSIINGGPGGKGGQGSNRVNNPALTPIPAEYNGDSSQFGIDTSSNPISIPLIDISDNLNAQYGGCGGGGGGPWGITSLDSDGGLGGGQNITALHPTIYYPYSYTAIGLKNGSYSGRSPQLGAAHSVVYGGGGGGFCASGDHEQFGADGMSGAVYFWLEPVAPPLPPPPPPVPPPISNRPGPINFCNSRFAKCNLNKKLGPAYSNGNVTIQGATNSQRMTELIRVQSSMRNAKLVFTNAPVNQYGRRAGGPGGYGSSPKNTFN